jgi:superfamily II RNA helicase
MIIKDKEYETTDPILNQVFKKWTFELSDFQKHAIDGIYNEKHVLITAHTASGKTLPAEFAIEHFIKNGKKVIYTAPIKALSNQKFRDFQNKFPDIDFGILTGDIKFNPEAQVLIMTTEILRNTLFQKQMIENDIIKEDQIELHFEMDIRKELGCVIFDEVHYINDANRGKVWEETIIMLPKTVLMVMLSATIDKPDKFASWVEKQSEREVILCPTDKRVVPLTHNAFFTCPKSIYETLPLNIKNIIDDDGFYEQTVLLKAQNKQFNDAKYHRLLKVMKHFKLNNIRVNDTFVLNQIVRYLKEKKLIPAICFVFSRKQVEIMASKISTNLFDKDSKKPSIVEAECKKIIMKLPNYKEYLTLPMFNTIIRLLQKGIAIHHAGIPQVFREMIELLFDKGYVKLLFATETFAIGINMPTKTVIFTSLKKYDGNGFRYLYSHEYTQAAGRAGRRGLDTVGYIYHLTNLFERKDESPNSTEYIKILNGKPQTLVSKFQIHFNILLNLISTSKKCTVDNMLNFVNKSMMNDTILKEKQELKIRINSITKTIEKRNEALKIKTPIDIMKKYIEYQENTNMYHRKKKKQMDKQITQWKNNFETFTEDIHKYKEIYNMENDLKRIEKNYVHANNFISSEVNNMLDILTRNDFILKNDDSWSLSIKGMIAANLQEIHPLAFSELLLEGIFKNHNTIDIITIISCFTNVSVPKQYCVINMDYINCDSNIKSTLKKMKNKMNKFYDIELQNRINNIDNYDIHWNMCELIHKWCHSENEEQCKQIYGEAGYYGISIGEFVKAILKINAIGLELEKACLLKEDLELLEKCKSIPKFTLKSIATNQSLYL